ncbi:hypothetical protein DPMN_098028 [Dreissena polymorpha]|uniref:Uncharacterized protein n=1 Tax=Dreissena polymorpha TaxID=45954 RepID=A0A9D4LED5_DREPO|nr:hypothetical protein DPMN_098028 [Dreissena polymorpha]
MLVRYPDFNMNLTTNRKQRTGLVRTEDPSKAGPMADFMKHREATVDRYYAVHKQE